MTRRSPVWRRWLLALVALLCLSTAAARPGVAAETATLEAAYVVLGRDGAVGRAILSGTRECPAIIFDGAAQPMQLRAEPEGGAHPAFPVLVCEALIPPGTTDAAISERKLPLPKSTIATIAVFGDTGCRLKDAEAQPLARRNSDHLHEGYFQNCDDPAQWPFPQISRIAAGQKPDLVIHVGDYLYRESPCPTGDAGCAGSPHGDDWPAWKADFFAPAAPLLATAPFIVVRGNHET
jgi:hypothetical protein